MQIKKMIIKNRVSQMLIKVVRFFFGPVYKYYSKRNNFSVFLPLETAEKLRDERFSLARFGDGEFNIMYKSRSIGFQKYSDDLRDALVDSFTIDDSDLQIGVPHSFISTSIDKLSVKVFWWSYVVNNHKMISKIVNETGRDQFFDTNFSRTITELKDKVYIKKVLKTVQEIWTDRDILLVEGKSTRFGVGNDLLNNARSVKRILARTENAFSDINELEKAVKNNIKNGNTLVLVALGPTASILAARIFKDVQVIDIGHFDLQYEYFLTGRFHKTFIANKYDNELVHGSRVVKVNDVKYTSEIVYQVEE